jgi:hypothetical protein
MENSRETAVSVACYSGQTYAERPLSFEWQGRRYEVAETEQAWREPGRRCFRVVTAAEERFILCYKEAQDKWYLI